MRTRMRLATALLVLAVGSGTASPVLAHGVIGKRFFPATLATEDPFVADELSLPTVSVIKQKGSEESPPTWITEISAELSKRLSPGLGLSISGTLLVLSPEGSPTIAGFDNLEIGMKYTFFKSAEHELLLSTGVDLDIGGTGQKRVDAESFSTVTPVLLFGKGMGDLPEAVWPLKPFAVTGVFGLAIPTREHNTVRSVNEEGEVETERTLNPRVFTWGLSFQYNFQYLQSFVRDIGLPRPFNRMIPLVELPMQTSVQGKSRTAGTINPGIIWFGRYVQIGLEAVIPINGNAIDPAKQPRQRSVGFLGQIHFYLDDIWPQGFTWTPFSGVLGPTQPQ
jgi:hypothetical protein